MAGKVVVEEAMIILEAVGKRKAIYDKDYGEIIFTEMKGYQGDCAEVPVPMARRILRDEQATTHSIATFNRLGAKGLIPDPHLRKGKVVNFITAVKAGEKRPKIAKIIKYEIKQITVVNEFVAPPPEEGAVEAPEMGQEPSISEKEAGEKPELNTQGEETENTEPVAAADENMQSLRKKANTLQIKGYLKLKKPELAEAINAA